MKNLIRGHIYQLKKDPFFLNCTPFVIQYIILSNK